MSSLKKDVCNPYFSHIYIEKDVLKHPVTKKILSLFPNAQSLVINHYKDIFCRKNQNFSLQKQTPGLILARKHDNLVYEGAPVCQNFGNQHFYYTSSVMNCIYDCEYCYLKGMYPSANIVIFVNLEEIFKEVKGILARHPVYLCVSYDTDLLALEQVLGYTKEWIRFTAEHRDLTIEIRTKSANKKVLDEVRPDKNVVFAWTLSPEKITVDFEKHTPAFEERLSCIQAAVKKGFQVRLCFDPLIYCRDWKEQYRNMFQRVFSCIRADEIKDVSLGVFRIPQDYLKRMRKQAPASAVLQFPYENDKGVYHYHKDLTEEMISFSYELVRKKLPMEKIFLWEKTKEEK